MAVVDVFKGGLFLDKEAIEPQAIMDAAPKEWFPSLSRFKIYGYVEFPSLERAYFGLAAVRGEPSHRWEASVVVGQTEMEVAAPLVDFGDALRHLKEESDHVFEEYPFVEVTSKADYNRALAIIIDVVDPQTSVKAWSPSVKKKLERASLWEGPGVYDFRDEPPTRSYESVEAYEGLSYADEAEQFLEYMFQGDEWKEALRNLIQEIRENT